MAVTALQAAQDVLDRARQLLALDDPDTPSPVRADVRRAALVLGVSALDTYVHWAIRKVSLADPLPPHLAKVTVTFGAMLGIANDSVAARKKGIANRPQVRARNALNEKLLTMTFQSPREIETGMSMLGIDKCWTKLSGAVVPPAAPKDLRERLSRLAHRRNMIVHEGDLVRLERPRTLRHEEIKRSTVEDDLDWLEAFVAALARVVG